MLRGNFCAKSTTLDQPQSDFKSHALTGITRFSRFSALRAAFTSPFFVRRFTVFIPVERERLSCPRHFYNLLRKRHGDDLLRCVLDPASTEICCRCSLESSEFCVQAHASAGEHFTTYLIKTLQHRGSKSLVRTDRSCYRLLRTCDWIYEDKIIVVPSNTTDRRGMRIRICLTQLHYNLLLVDVRRLSPRILILYLPMQGPD